MSDNFKLNDANIFIKTIAINLSIKLIIINVFIFFIQLVLAQNLSASPCIATFRDCPECPEMVIVPAGSFFMGSSDADTARDLGTIDDKNIPFYKTFPAADSRREHPKHLVKKDKSFALGKYPITRGQGRVPPRGVTAAWSLRSPASLAGIIKQPRRTA